MSESQRREPRELALACDCVGRCTTLLVVEPWEDEHDPERHYSIDFHQHVMAQEGWRGRLRIIWQVLRGRGPYVHGIVFYIDKARELRDFLNETVPPKAPSYTVSLGDPNTTVAGKLTVWANPALGGEAT